MFKIIKYKPDINALSHTFKYDKRKTHNIIILKLMPYMKDNIYIQANNVS